MKSIAELNKQYQGKNILIIGNHPNKGDECEFVAFKSVPLSNTPKMQVRNKKGELFLLTHKEVFVIVGKQNANDN